MNLIDSAIADFYNATSEDTRLQLGLGPLEFERNKSLITRYLNSGLIPIADIGGGTGHYAKWLSGLGHNVVLVDPVEKHIKLANHRSKNSKRTFKCLLGEAQKLPFSTCSFDLVILHGPLYHLQSEEDRHRALLEARRVLKPGGTVLGFAITHAASTLAALHAGMIHHASVFEMCKTELIGGEHHAPIDIPGTMPESYFHRPTALREEFRAAGLEVHEILAVEGMAWMDSRFFESWANPDKKRRLLELIELTESDPELLCFSPHVMIAAGLNYA